MWQLIEVAGQQFMASCTFAEEHFKYILYDGADNETFGETIAKQEVLERAAGLNKRTKYPPDTVHETLTNAAPVEALLDNTTEGDITLKLKYHVKNLPLRYTWHIKPMPSKALWQCVVAPMLAAIGNLSAQVDELRECVQKKDVEIRQYKREGANLIRSTVATQPYNFEKADVQYKGMQTQINGYQSLANYLKKIDNRLLTGELLSPSTTHAAQAKAEEECTSLTGALNKKISPRNRKRKAMEFSKMHVERKVIQRRQIQHLVYKDSQSQDDSQGDEETKPLKASDVEQSTTSSDRNVTTCSADEVTEKSTTPEQLKFEPLVYETSSDDENNCTLTSTSRTKNKNPQNDRAEQSTSNSKQKYTKSESSRNLQFGLSTDGEKVCTEQLSNYTTTTTNGSKIQ